MLWVLVKNGSALQLKGSPYRPDKTPLLLHPPIHSPHMQLGPRIPALSCCHFPKPHQGEDPVLCQFPKSQPGALITRRGEHSLDQFITSTEASSTGWDTRPWAEVSSRLILVSQLVSMLDDHNRADRIPRKAQRPSQTIPSSAPSELSTLSMQKEME